MVRSTRLPNPELMSAGRGAVCVAGCNMSRLGRAERSSLSRGVPRSMTFSSWPPADFAPADLVAFVALSACLTSVVKTDPAGLDANSILPICTELDFCANFYKHLVRSDGLDGVSMNIDFGGRFASEFVDCLVRDVSWVVDKKTGSLAISRISSTSASIHLEDCFDLIVNLRNGFFHHLAGSNKSISSYQVKNADEFFTPINELALQVIGYMFGKTYACIYDAIFRSTRLQKLIH
jgi:hypothetical protein